MNNPFDKLQVALNFEIGDTNKVTEAMSYQSELKRRILVTGPHIDWEKVTLYPNRFSKPLIGALRVASTNRDILHV